MFLTVDCLRSDHCGFYGYRQPTTPFLDTLAAESFVVPTAIVAGAPTYYSFPAILASRMPLALGRDVIGLAPDESTLTTSLLSAGYTTAAFTAANPYISRRFGYDVGFEVFEDFARYSTNGGSTTPGPVQRENGRTKVNQRIRSMAYGAKLGHLYEELYFQYRLRVAAGPVKNSDSLRKFPSAEVLVDRAIDWLASVSPNCPFFLWIHFMDPHAPYYPSEKAFRELTGRELDADRARYLNEFWNRSDLTLKQFGRKKSAVLQLYDAGIHFVDSQVARLKSYLQESGRWGTCTFVLTADHGEEFLDHGRRYHAPLNLHDEIAKVPLMIRVPGSLKKNQLPRSAFSLLHIAPTILEILDVEIPRSFEGRSLWKYFGGEVAWNEEAISECVPGCSNPFRANDRSGPRLFTVREGRFKLVIPSERSTQEQMYDLEADPNEHHPLSRQVEKENRRRLLRTAEGHLRKAREQRDEMARLRARLRDLRVELETDSR